MPANYDLIIIGGGSAGVGACLAAASAGPDLQVLLVERDEQLGGTSTTGGVHNWEPGFTSGRWHAEIASRLQRSGGGFVGKTSLYVTAERPLAFSVPCTDPYESTQRRAGLAGDDYRRFHFEPQALSAVLTGLIGERRNITLLGGTTFMAATVKDRRINSVCLQQGTRELICTAPLFIDATADIVLARAAGCGWTSGQEAATVYDEPSAPDQPDSSVNAVSLIFRVTPKPEAGVDPIPAPYGQIDVSTWMQANFPHNRPVTFVTQYPDGDYCFNMLPTMEGAEYLALDDAAAYTICQARVYRYFQWLQQEKGLGGYRIKAFAPRVGIRETNRLLARYVLNERDLRAPFGSQAHFDEAIAFADHSIDIHGRPQGRAALSRALDKPYAIPYSCLLPREVDNLLVASRGAGFSHLAASSCRLSRTMMALGEAAGEAAAISRRTGALPADIDRRLLQDRLGIGAQVAAIREEFGL